MLNAGRNRGSMPQGPSAALLMASVITGLHFLSLTFSRPLFPLLAADMGASDALIGLLTSASYLLPLVVALPAGMLIDRVGIKSLAVFGSICLLAGNVAYAVAGGFAMIAAARVLNGLAQVVVLVALQAYVAELGRGGQQDKNFATIFFFTGIGQLVGPLMAGFLAREVGMRFSFWTAAAIAILPLGLAAVLPALEPARARAGTGVSRPQGQAAAAVDDAPGGAHTSARSSGASGSREGRAAGTRLDLAAIGRLLRIPGVQLGVGASLIMLLAEGARESFYPLYASSVGFDEVAVGALLSLHALFSILVQPFAGSLAAAWGRTRVLSAAMLCGFIGHIAVPLVRGFWPMAAAIAFAGVAMGANQPPSMACVADAAPKDMRGVAMALRLTGNRAGLLLSPVITGWAVTLWGLSAYFYASAGMLIAGSALMAGIASRTLRQPPIHTGRAAPVPGRSGAGGE